MGGRGLLPLGAGLLFEPHTHRRCPDVASIVHFATIDLFAAVDAVTLVGKVSDVLVRPLCLLLVRLFSLITSSSALLQFQTSV